MLLSAPETHISRELLLSFPLRMDWLFDGEVALYHRKIRLLVDFDPLLSLSEDQRQQLCFEL